MVTVAVDSDEDPITLFVNILSLLVRHCLPRHEPPPAAPPSPGRSAPDPQAEIESDAAGAALAPAGVEKQLGRILRPRYHAGSGRSVAGVHHPAV